MANQRLVVDLTLASFVTGVAELQIPQLSLFYFRKEGATASTTTESAAAESLTIPGPVIAVRSTLPPRASDAARRRDGQRLAAQPLDRVGRRLVGGCAARRGPRLAGRARRLAGGSAARDRTHERR